MTLMYVLSYSLYGDNEELVGKWFRRTGKRDDIFLATKFGFVKGGKSYEVDSSAEYCKKACAESLRVLGVEYIDLCKSSLSLTLMSCKTVLNCACIRLDWLHNANPKTPIEETMRAMVELQKYNIPYSSPCDEFTHVDTLSGRARLSTSASRESAPPPSAAPAKSPPSPPSRPTTPSSPAKSKVLPAATSSPPVASSASPSLPQPPSAGES